jgi:hypothetical protein
VTSDVKTNPLERRRILNKGPIAPQVGQPSKSYPVCST